MEGGLGVTIARLLSVYHSMQQQDVAMPAGLSQLLRQLDLEWRGRTTYICPHAVSNREPLHVYVHIIDGMFVVSNMSVRTNDPSSQGGSAPTLHQALEMFNEGFGDGKNLIVDSAFGPWLYYTPRAFMAEAPLHVRQLLATNDMINPTTQGASC
jgi:hypothetical protein